MKTVYVRQIETSEYEAAAQVVLTSFLDCVASSMEPRGITVFEEFSTAHAIRSRDASGCVTYVAIEDTQVVGVLHVKDGDHISLLFVLPDFQGKGIGNALIQKADQFKMLATVHSSTIALKAYESYGFRACGPEQLSDGIRFVPMQRSVNPSFPKGSEVSAHPTE